MAEGISPGDVVAATRSFGPEPFMNYRIEAGTRSTVIQVFAFEAIDADTAKCGCAFGFWLEDYSLSINTSFCGCNWRKIGGSRADTMRLFAQPFSTKAPSEKVG